MRKNKKIKIASAKDIYNYLSSIMEDGVANVSKKDIALHFGYKSSNGDGFLANFKFLTDNGLIEVDPVSKKSGMWKVNSIDSFEFPEKIVGERAKEKREMRASKTKSKKSKLKVNLECLKPIEYCGRKYIPLVNIAMAFGINKHGIYNAASSKVVEAYTQNVLDESTNTHKKSIEIEGLAFLFEKLRKKVDSRMLVDALKHVKSNFDETYAINTQNSKLKKSKDTKIKSKTKKETAISNLQSSSPVVVSVETADEITVDLEKEKKFNADNVSSTSTVEDETISMLDGILSIISEHRDMKSNLTLSMDMVSKLQNEIKELNSQISSLISSDELEELNRENKELKKQLELSTQINTEMINKTNLIRNYISENNKAVNQ